MKRRRRAGIAVALALASAGCGAPPRREAPPPPLTRAILDRSLAAGTRFLLNNQRPAGNFAYEYDWIRRKDGAGDSPVRQAGALWGLALIYQDNPREDVATALEKGIAFFARHTRRRKDGGLYVVYPGTFAGETGTVALCALAHIDYLRAGAGLSPAARAVHRRRLDGYLRFLLAARRADGLWFGHYAPHDGRCFGLPSSYYDGEALLAVTKAALYLGRDDLKPVALAAAAAGYRKNVTEALAADRDSDVTKGYYQWASMAFFELARSGWPGTVRYGDYTIAMADWMIDVHQTLRRTRNTGYAYEGIIPAYELARERGDRVHADKFRTVIEQGLARLTSWQVGGPIPSRYLAAYPTKDPRAVGGVQNHARQVALRIDVTQHQMHAVILARRYVYPLRKGERP